jgi:hypothetical protein
VAQLLLLGLRELALALGSHCSRLWRPDRKIPRGQSRARRLPVLMAITFRPEFQPPWVGRSHVTSLALNRLGERDGAVLAQKLAGNATLNIIAKIVERTDGVPLFVEELTKAVLERADQERRVAAVLSAGPLPALAVPATLHASLNARLDRIGPAAREVAQICSVLGREFTYELIERLAARLRSDLDSALAQLTEAGLFRADLSTANLEGANLDGATLLAANLTLANLGGANLEKARRRARARPSRDQHTLRGALALFEHVGTGQRDTFEATKLRLPLAVTRVLSPSLAAARAAPCSPWRVRASANVARP